MTLEELREERDSLKQERIDVPLHSLRYGERVERIDGLLEKNGGKMALLLKNEREGIMAQLQDGGASDPELRKALYQRLEGNLKENSADADAGICVLDTMAAFTALGRDGWQHNQEVIPILVGLLFSRMDWDRGAARKKLLEGFVGLSIADPGWLHGFGVHILDAREGSTDYDMIPAFISAASRYPDFKTHAGEIDSLVRDLVRQLISRSLEGHGSAREAAKGCLCDAARRAHLARVVIMKEIIALLGSKRFQEEHGTLWKSNAIDTIGSVFATSVPGKYADYY